MIFNFVKNILNNFNNYFQNNDTKFLFLSSYIKFHSNSYFTFKFKFENFRFDVLNYLLNFILDLLLFSFSNLFKKPYCLDWYYLRISMKLIAIIKRLFVLKYFEYQRFLFFCKIFILGMDFLFFEYCWLYFIFLPKQR